MEIYLHTCNSVKDYRKKERIIHNFLKNDPDYTSKFYCGANGKPDLFDVDGFPLIPILKNKRLRTKLKKMEVVFEKININRIKRELL